MTKEELTNELFDAIDANDLIKIKKLIDDGADINNLKKMNGLISPLFHTLTNNKLEVAKLLIENGADVDAIFGNGERPLHMTALGNYLEIANLLVDRVADINALNKFEHTPLDYANTPEMYELLIQHGGIKTEQEEVIEE